MKKLNDENDAIPPHDAIAMSNWWNQVTEQCRVARENGHVNGTTPERPQQAPPWTHSKGDPTPRERHYAPPRQREPHICKNPDGLITKSWTDTMIREQRTTRDHVECIVDSEPPREFRSLAQAFENYELPKKLLTDLRKRVKSEYRRFIAGESESEFVAIDYDERMFVFRIIKKG